MEEKKKAGRYERIYKQIKELTSPVNNPTSRMATISAILHHKINYYYWTGFYLYNAEESKLTVGPYQGPLACLNLKKDTGVCWAGVNGEQTVIVPDVEKFPGHIACSSATNSEIVVPVIKDNKVYAVLDVDSREYDSFDQVDAEWLEKIVELIFA